MLSFGGTKRINRRFLNVTVIKKSSPLVLELGAVYVVLPETYAACVPPEQPGKELREILTSGLLICSFDTAFVVVRGDRVRLGQDVLEDALADFVFAV